MVVWVVFARVADGPSVMLHLFEAKADAKAWIKSRAKPGQYLGATLYVMKWNVVGRGEGVS